MPKKKRAKEWPRPKGRVEAVATTDTRFAEILRGLIAVDDECYEPKHRNVAALSQSEAARRATGLVAAWDQEAGRVRQVHAVDRGQRGEG